MKHEYTDRCEQLEERFCRMVEEDTGGDWDWRMLEQYGSILRFTDLEIYLVGRNLGCYIPKKVLAKFEK